RPRLVMGVHPVVPGASRQYLADDRALFPARDDRQQPLRRRPGSAQLELRGRRFAMKGNVIGFDPDTNTGAISGYDGKRYDFATVDWHSQHRPKHGDLVDFVPDGQHASQVYPLEPEYVPPSLGQFLFSPAGPTSRSQFWLRWFLPVVAIHIVLWIVIAIGAAADSTTVATTFFVIWIVFS